MCEKFCPFAGGDLGPTREKFASVSLEPEPQNGSPQPLPLRIALRIVRSLPLALPHGSGRGRQVREPDHPAGQEAGSSTQILASRSTGRMEGQTRDGLRTIPLASHPCASASRVDALAHAAWGQTRARRPSRRRVTSLVSHPALNALATVRRGGEWGVETIDPVASPPSPPSPVQPLCPIRTRSTMAWRGRGRASWVGRAVGGGLSAAGLCEAFRDRGRAGGCRGARAARILRVFRLNEFAVSFHTAHPTPGAPGPVWAPISALWRAA
jgi:hypothetical protein